MNSQLTTHLWQSTFFAATAGLMTLAFRRNRAQVRYWLWLSASLKFFIPFALLLGLGNYLETRMPAAGEMATRIAARISTPAVASVLEPFDRSLPVEPSGAPPAQGLPWIPVALFGTWLCGFIVIALIRFHGWLRIRKLVGASTSAKVPARTDVRMSRGLLEPGVIGVWRPILLLPEGIAERLTPAELNAVLAYELCHIRRRDNFFAAIHMVVEAIFWFHPLVWWIGARRVEERERACDEEVLGQGNHPDVYADAILSVCKLYVQSPLACASGVSAGSIRRRVEAILRNEVRLKVNLTKRLLLILAGVAAIAVPIATGVMDAPLLTAQALPTSVASGSTSRLEFEVASIRPAGPMNLPGGGRGISVRGGIPGRCRQTFTLDQGHLDIRCYSLGGLMWAWAFGLPPARLAGLNWMGDVASDWSGGERFDISAKLAEGASRDQVPAMLQNLLAARFKLATHREYREQPVYALIAAKSGPTVQPASQSSDSVNAAADPQRGEPSNMNGVYFYAQRVPNPDGSGSQILIMNSPRMGSVRNSESGSPRYTWRYEAPSITFGGLADLLTISGVVDPEPVIDMTGEKGRYQVVLEMSMAELEALRRDGSRDDIPSANFKAAQDGLKKLGLQLEHRKAPIEVLVVDHLEKAPTEN